jgi:hypothetical protein
MRKSIALFSLCGAIVLATFAGERTRGQDAKKGTAEARRAAAERDLKAAADADDAVVRQWEGQFGPQLRQVYRGELHLMRLVTEPTKAQYEKIAANGDAIIKSAIRKYVQAMQGRGGDQFDPRESMAKEIAKSVRETLSPEQSARYEKEIELRTAARKRLVFRNLVAMTDRILVFRPDQREKLSEILAANWDESWNQTQILMYGGQYFPPLPDAKIEPILTDVQRTVWRGIHKNQVRFGINFGFVPGIDIEDEAWDEGRPAASPAKPDDKNRPKNGAAPKAAEKP